MIETTRRWTMFLALFAAMSPLGCAAEVAPKPELGTTAEALSSIDATQLAPLNLADLYFTYDASGAGYTTARILDPRRDSIPQELMLEVADPYSGKAMTVNLSLVQVDCGSTTAYYSGWDYQFCSVVDAGDTRPASSPGCTLLVTRASDTAAGGTPSCSIKPMRPPKDCCNFQL